MTAWKNMWEGFKAEVKQERARRNAPPKYESPYAQDQKPEKKRGKSHPSDGRRQLVPDWAMDGRKSSGYKDGGHVKADMYGDYTRSADSKHMHRKS